MGKRVGVRNTRLGPIVAKEHRSCYFSLTRQLVSAAHSCARLCGTESKFKFSSNCIFQFVSTLISTMRPLPIPMLIPILSTSPPPSASRNSQRVKSRLVSSDCPEQPPAPLHRPDIHEIAHAKVVKFCSFPLFSTSSLFWGRKRRNMMRSIT